MAEGQIDINALLVEQGWALAYRRYSMDYVDEENTAEASRAGMWAGEFMKPWEWRKK
jgi:endonuclease YncB( thermonuclease family)